MRIKKHTVTALLLSASLLCAGCSGFPGPSAQTGTGSTGQPDTQTNPFPEADGDSQGTGPGTGTEETENADSLTEDSEDYTTSDYDAHYNSLFGEDYIRPWMDADIQGVLEQSGPADVKDDFYAAINRDWIINAKIPDGYSSYDTISERQREVDSQMIDLLTDRTLTGPEAQITQTVYDLWMDWDARNSEGVSALSSVINDIREIDSLEDLTAYQSRFETAVSSIMLMDAYTSADLNDSTHYTVYVDPMAFILEDPYYYTYMGPDGYNMQPVYTDTIYKMLMRCGFSEQEAGQIISDSYSFEYDVAQHCLTTEDRYAEGITDRINNPRTLEELASEQGHFPLTSMLKGMKMDTSRTYNLTEPEWLACMSDLYTEDNVGRMKAYLMAQNCIEYIELLDRDSYDLYGALHQETSGIQGQIEDETAAYNCIEDYLSRPIGQLYCQKYVSADIKADITELTNDIIREYRTMLEEEDFLSEATRKEAVQKLDSIRTKICYPEETQDYSDLRIKSKEEGGTLTDAMMAISQYNLETGIANINQEVDKDKWKYPPQEVNASYSPSENSICISAGILGGSIYSLDMSREEKYAMIGVAIAHEITHAFDTSGAHYDENGNLRDWWQPEDYTAFRKKADKLIGYYNNVIPMEGMKYSGERVDTEAIADLGGMKCMLRMASSIDGFDYKKFFESYAHLWCSISTAENEWYKAEQDSHPLSYLRVNAVVQQFDEFIETYQIQEGDGMYLAPEDRISVW